MRERVAGWLKRPVATTREMPGKPATWLAGTTPEEGNRSHRAACAAGPAGDCPRLAIVQWCFPSRRQQGGSFESGSDANTAGAISEKLKRDTSSDARIRRTTLF